MSLGDILELPKVCRMTDAGVSLTEQTFFILLSLAAEPRHGYAILKEVQRLSDERILLSTGTLYGAIKRLLEQGWIEELEAAPEPGQRGKDRRVYALTRRGRQSLEQETARLKCLVNMALQHQVGEQP